jgi:hypothetical protein
LGDTTKIVDLKISQINVNKYAFPKINFLEVLNYSGDKNLSADFTIREFHFGKQSIAFSSSKKS